MTHAEDARRVWVESQRLKRALLLAREAQKQLDPIRREQDRRDTEPRQKPKEKK